jgi:hypothetical protein
MRLCRCGCGKAVTSGNPRKLYVDNTHRMRAARSGNGHVAVDVEPSPLDTEPGRARAGLETWLADVGELPTVLVEAARVLADQVDAEPSDSPLWGRYSHLLAALIDAWREERPFVRGVADDILDSHWTLDAIEQYRAERYREATTDAARRRWVRMVPIGCSRGDHDWLKWPAGRVECRGCGAEPEPPSGSTNETRY